MPQLSGHSAIVARGDSFDIVLNADAGKYEFPELFQLIRLREDSFWNDKKHSSRCVYKMNFSFSRDLRKSDHGTIE